MYCLHYFEFFWNSVTITHINSINVKFYNAKNLLKDLFRHCTSLQCFNPVINSLTKLSCLYYIRGFKLSISILVTSTIKNIYIFEVRGWMCLSSFAWIIIFWSNCIKKGRWLKSECSSSRHEKMSEQTNNLCTDAKSPCLHTLTAEYWLTFTRCLSNNRKWWKCCPGAHFRKWI